ncbi:MAG: hypothetical protein ABJO01_07070 [Parasphingorhabdus sp.]|uniref:protein-tyrosine phosphatase family protein n=1 Tax=Parasphingorhabdus sp. TaxID=2709688 RepID=UPI0032999384
MKPSIYLVASKLPGNLFIMPKPSGEWLREDMAHYRAMGINTIISMLEPQEASELSLVDEGAICLESGMDFVQFPITDRGLPEPEPFQNLVADIITRLRNAEDVAVHCRAGIGRSGMAVCCALLGFDHSVEEAVALTSKARGVPVPDTAEQRAFIDQVALALR